MEDIDAFEYHEAFAVSFSLSSIKISFFLGIPFSIDIGFLFFFVLKGPNFWPI